MNALAFSNAERARLPEEPVLTACACRCLELLGNGLSPKEASAFVMLAQVQSCRVNSWHGSDTVCLQMLVQVSTGLNWLRTVGRYGTYLAGPAEPV